MMSHDKKSDQAVSAAVTEEFAGITPFEQPIELRYAVNIRETDHKYELQVIAPGFKKGDFNITTHGGSLTITAEHSHREKGEDIYIRREFIDAPFSRAFKLPENVMTDHLSAEYQEGILTIDLKKNNRFLIGKKQVKVD